MAKVLIIDDDHAMCEMLIGMVEEMGHFADSASSKVSGARKVSTNSYDVVFLDVNLPDGSGLDILPDIRGVSSAPEVIVMTGYGDPDGAEIAIKNGAWDYLQKPLSPKKLLLPLTRVLKHRDDMSLNQKPIEMDKIGIIGNGPAISDACRLLSRSAVTNSNVMITGATGCGKDLFARAIHENSTRKNNRFVIVDCASLPENLVESVLFGHVKGAFTGAERDQEGLIRQADGGTLFLDEIGELPLSIQKSFLRVLQERRFRAVGGDKEISSDFRLICATNREPKNMVKEGTFREDLFYRLNSILIDLPTLKNRKEDIEDIVNYHLERICKRNGTTLKECSREFLLTLKDYHWPGNVRELVNALENACSECGNTTTLLAIHLPLHIRIQFARKSVNGDDLKPEETASSQNVVESFPAFRDLMDQTEKRYLRDILTHTGGNIKECCEITGLSRSRIYALLKKHNISKSFN